MRGLGVVLCALALVAAACSSEETSSQKQAPTEPQATEPQATETSGGGGIELRLVADGLDSPLGIASTPSEPDRLFIVEQPGLVRVVEDGKLLPQPFLDVEDQVVSGGEQGLLSLAFDPEYESTGLFYVDYTDTNGDTRVVEYEAGDSATVKRRELLFVDQPYANHNGGQLQFGPDGYLYIGMGDGGSAGDPGNRAQDKTKLLGKILRIDVNGVAGQPADCGGSNYTIPADNPFASHPNPDFQPWFAYGVRNSFGLGFDPLTRRLWDTENGGGNYDEVNLVAPGFNSGWSLIMGPDSRNPGSETDLVHLPGSAYSDPEFSFRSSVAPTSIAFLADSVLGDAYRDAVLVAAYNRHGLFLFRLNEARDGFVLSGGLRDLVAEGTAEEEAVRFGSGFGTITDLKVGPDGAVYALNYDLGNIYRITPEPGALGTVSVPALLLLRRRRASS